MKTFASSYIVFTHLLKHLVEKYLLYFLTSSAENRGGICPCRHCQRQCKIFARGVNFSIFTHFLCFFLLKVLKLGEIDGVKCLA